MKRALGLLAAVIAGLLFVTISRADSVPRGAGADVLERSAALAEAAPVGRFAADVGVPAAAARAFADGVSEEIPLPEGGSLDGIQWELAGGEFTPEVTRMILQYNALCQWVRAWRDGRDIDVSDAVLADIPRWSAWRGTEAGAVVATAIAELVGGGGPAADALLADCDRSHAQEVRYAHAQGLTPSR